eukprot:TRINITY_DN17652_c0_g1_i2.p1 TRINITY_DN17652_c0_g1~~TRINITY_DN17652_c0_g1_i2.p1  ORF type:complete len:368 (+),score=5.88 TRINITY_DN17652_c0_g1_i2:186-1289(+)
MARTLARGSQWLETEEENESIIADKHQLKIFGFPWDKEILEKKGPYPQFTVYFTIISQAIANIIEIVIVCGYGTNWYLPGLIPITIGSMAGAITSIVELRIPTDNKSQIVTLKLSQGILLSLIPAGFVLILIRKKPFNNMIIFICVQIVTFMFGFYSTIQSKLSEHEAQQQNKQTRMNFADYNYDGKFLQKPYHRNYGAIYRNQIKNKDSAQEIDKKKKYLFLKSWWTTFACCVTAIDFFSDAYYGIQLQRYTTNDNIPFRIAGILILLTAVVDLAIVHFTFIQPQKVNHKSHIGALFLEIFSFSGTAYSLYVLATGGDHEIISKFQDGISFAIFSLITTVLAVILHGFYVADYFAQKSALEQIQQM